MLDKLVDKPAMGNYQSFNFENIVSNVFHV